MLDTTRTLEQRAEECVRLANLSNDPIIQAELLKMRQRIFAQLKYQRAA
jgi:hypothetical protein